MKTKKYRFAFLNFARITALLLLCSVTAFSQNKKNLSIEASERSEEENVKKLLGRISYKEMPVDTSAVSLEKKLREIIFSIYEEGYLSASFDSIHIDSLTIRSYLHPGEKYSWLKIKKGNVSSEFLKEAGFREKNFSNKPVYYSELIRYEKKIIEACENNGFPFASVKLDSVQIRDNSISAVLNVDPGHLYHIDSLVVRGTADISDVYIRNYLGIKPGDIYNESLISRISVRLHEIPFVTESQPFQAEFTEKTCKLILFLEKKKASQINGILGILPDETKPGKIILTGELLLKLSNPFGGGEMMELNWKSPKPKTQDLKTHLVYPFIYTRFGLDLAFGIYKKDTTYTDITKEAGIQYLLPRGNYLKAFVNNKTSSLQSLNGLESLTVLPDYADVNSTIYGLGIRSEKLDYRYNPRKGTALEATAGAGTRVITKIPKINPALYDSIPLRSNQFSGKYIFDYYIKLQSRTVLDLGGTGAHLISPVYFSNELFHIGGLKTLRGFDEESILASSYDILKVELRYILEQNSFFSVFWNGAYYENRSLHYAFDRYDTPYGFGSGISFDTKLGIFTIDYAFGKQFNNDIQWKNGKVHFGLVNSF